MSMAGVELLESPQVNLEGCQGSFFAGFFFNGFSAIQFLYSAIQLLYLLWVLALKYNFCIFFSCSLPAPFLFNYCINYGIQ